MTQKSTQRGGEQHHCSVKAQPMSILGSSTQPVAEAWHQVPRSIWWKQTWSRGTRPAHKVIVSRLGQNLDTMGVILFSRPIVHPSW